MIAHRASTFVFTVKGDSTLAAEILGAIVNCKYTVERLIKWPGVVQLRAKNPAYKTIRFAKQEFHLVAHSAILAFIVVFVISKALTNYFASRFSDVYGRKSHLNCWLDYCDISVGFFMRFTLTIDG